MPDATSFSPWGAAAQAANGLISSGIGLIQRAQAKKWLKNNPMQMETMPVEVRRNQQLAELMANTGMPSEQYNNGMKNIMRNQMISLRAAREQGGGKGLSILGGLNQYGNDAVGDLDARDASMRIDNQGRLIDVNNNVANWKSQLFDRNVRQKWMREYDQNMSQLGAGNQNITGGLDKIFAAGGSMLGGGQEGGGSSGRTGNVTGTVNNLPRTQTGVLGGMSPANSGMVVPPPNFRQATYPSPMQRPYRRIPQYNQLYYGG